MIIYQDSILYDFQKEALNNAKKNYLYALDTGTGKTITSIHHYLKHASDKKLLIVAPPAKIKEGGWDKDISFVEKTYNIKIAYEILSYGKLSKDWHLYRDHFVIFDEAHYIKNPTSQRGKAALHLTRQSDGFCLLTATPMSNGWQDSYNYFIMFGCFKNKTAMNKRHAIYETKFFGMRQIPQIVGWQYENELEKMYQSFAVSISKDEALDLPDLVYRKVFFKPSTLYRKLKRDRVINDEPYDTPAKLAAGLRFYTNQKDKLDYLSMICEGTTENIIVFYQFKQELENIKGIIKDKIIYEVNGQCFNLPKTVPENSVTLVQYQAGSAGIELQYANIVVFYTPTYSYQDYSQSLGRAYRNGQTKKVTVYQFNTEDTIEENVWDALSNKKDFSEKRYLDTKLGGSK